MDVVLVPHGCIVPEPLGTALDLRFLHCCFCVKWIDSPTPKSHCWLCYAYRSLEALFEALKKFVSGLNPLPVGLNVPKQLCGIVYVAAEKDLPFGSAFEDWHVEGIDGDHVDWALYTFLKKIREQDEILLENLKLRYHINDPGMT